MDITSYTVHKLSSFETCDDQGHRSSRCSQTLKSDRLNLRKPKMISSGTQVFTSDHALKMEWVPDWIAIIGSGYIGLEFSDVYTALGSEVTFIEVRHSTLATCGCLDSP